MSLKNGTDIATITSLSISGGVVYSSQKYWNIL